MSYTLSQFVDSIARETHGRTANRFQDIYETAYDAALILLSEIDPKETQRMAQISPQLFDEVDVYSSPSDFKALIDVYPTRGRKYGEENTENFRRTTQREFNTRRNIEAPLTSEYWRNGTKFLLMRKYPQTGGIVQLESFDSTKGITEGGDGTSLERDDLNFFEGGASLKFEVTGATGVTTLTKTLTTQDLTNYRLLSSWFIKLYIPSGFSSYFTSLQLKHGSSSGNYWSKTATTPHDGTSFKDGWNIIRFDWSSATQTGTVDETLMNYMQFTLTTTAGTNIPGIIIDDFNIQLGTMYNLEYFSNFLFRTAAGVWIEKPTALTDIINLSTDEYKIFTDLGAMMAMSEVSSLDKDYERISRRVGWPVNPDEPFKGTLGTYKRQYPSERPTSTTILHDFSV